MTTNSARDGRLGRAATPLVGRTDILEALAGERAIVLRGEPGSGKSRLLAEARVRDIGSTAVTVRVHRGVAAPFEPIESLVAALQRRSGAPDRAADGRDRLVTLRETLESLAAVSPLLLQIDDIHRASPAALDAIAYCVDRTEDSAIRWQFAARPASEVDRIWADVARDGVLRFIDIPPLDESETQRLAIEIAGAAPENLYRATGGNPLYIEHLAISRGGAGAGGLRAVLENRMRELSSEPARVAATLAIARRPLDLGTLVRASEPGSQELVRSAVEVLETAGVVRAGAGGFDFAHDLLREACVGLLSVSQARDLHAALATLSTNDIERAEHLLGAGRFEEARDAFLAVARAALLGLAFAEATSVLSRMDEAGLLRSHPSWETSALAAVAASFAAGGAPPFPEELARREGVDAAIAVVYLRAFLRTTGRPEYQGAVDAAASALADPAIAPSDRTAFRVFMAKAHYNRNEFGAAFAASVPEAGDVLESPAGFELRAVNALYYGISRDVDEGRARLMALATDAKAREIPSFPSVFEALACLEGTINNSVGEWFWAKVGLEWAGGTIEARRFHDLWGYGAMNCGKPHEAVEAFAVARAFYARRRMRPPGFILSGEAEAAAWAGDPETVESDVDERDLSYVIEEDLRKIFLAYGMLAEFRGDLDLARRRYLRCLERVRIVGPLASVALVLLTRVAARRSDRAAADEFADLCITLSVCDGPYFDACLFYAALAGNDPAELRIRCHAALAAGLPFLERAMVLGLFGERARDRDALGTAIGMFDSAGAARHAEHFREIARRLGFRPGTARARASKPVLTPRESEIVRLVAEGMTNREIAARLNVSPKTVAAGVSAVLEKCGMTSRVDIATRVASGRGFELVTLA